MDTSGNLYGTTGGGGAFGNGTLFELTPPSTAGENWTESILRNFGNGADGQNPQAGLIMDAAPASAPIVPIFRSLVSTRAG